MARVLRISAVVPLPDDAFDQADALAEMRKPIQAFRDALPADAEFTTEVVTPRERKVEEPAAEMQTRRRGAGTHGAAT